MSPQKQGNCTDRYIPIKPLKTVDVALASCHRLRLGDSGPPWPQSSGALSRQHAVGLGLFLCHPCCLLPSASPPLLILTAPVGCLSRLIPPDLNLASHQGYLPESKFCLGFKLYDLGIENVPGSADPRVTEGPAGSAPQGVVAPGPCFGVPRGGLCVKRCCPHALGSGRTCIFH